jgi:hypothetical protein
MLRACYDLECDGSIRWAELKTKITGHMLSAGMAAYSSQGKVLKYARQSLGYNGSLIEDW